MNQPAIQTQIAPQPQPGAPLQAGPQPPAAALGPPTDLISGPQRLLSPRLSDPPVPIPGVIPIPRHIILRTQQCWTTYQIARLQILIPQLDMIFANAFEVNDAALLSASLAPFEKDMAILEHLRTWLVIRLPERHLPELPELFQKRDLLAAHLRTDMTFMEDALAVGHMLKLVPMREIFDSPEFDVWEDYGTYKPERPDPAVARKRANILYILALTTMELCQFDLARQTFRHFIGEHRALKGCSNFAQNVSRYYIGVTLFHEGQFACAWEVFSWLWSFLMAGTMKKSPQPYWHHLLVDIRLMGAMTLVCLNRSSDGLRNLSTAWMAARTQFRPPVVDKHFGRVLAWSLAGGTSPVHQDMWKIRQW